MACLGSHSYSDGDVNLIYNIYDIYLYYILLYVYILYDTISYADNIVSQVPTVIHGMVHSQDVSLRSQEETSRLRSFGCSGSRGPRWRKWSWCNAGKTMPCLPPMTKNGN